MKDENEFSIVIPIYEGVDLLDVTIPYEVFNWVNNISDKSNESDKRTLRVYTVAETDCNIATRDSFKLVPDFDFSTFEQNSIQTKLIWVPGGKPESLNAQMNNSAFKQFIRRQSEIAEYVVSVCEGALLLADAGLLDGYYATTHWAFKPCLEKYKNVKVAEGFPRYVIDGNRITGGGVSSGLDESLAIIQLLNGTELAKQVQKSIQYLPDPPVSVELQATTVCPLDKYNTMHE